MRQVFYHCAITMNQIQARNLFIYLFTSSGSSGTQTLDLGLMWGVSYHCVTATGQFLARDLFVDLFAIFYPGAMPAVLVGLKVLILGWWDKCSTIAQSPQINFRQGICLFICQFLFWCQWQEQDSNPWSWDDEASVVPLRYHCEPILGKEFIYLSLSISLLVPVAGARLKPLILGWWDKCSTTELPLWTKFRQELYLFISLPSVAAMGLKPFDYDVSVLLPCYLLTLANLKQGVDLYNSAIFSLGTSGISGYQTLDLGLIWGVSYYCVTTTGPFQAGNLFSYLCHFFLLVLVAVAGLKPLILGWWS
jgi:hypothetical protein